MGRLSDISLMPFGEYKNHKMVNVPAEYLLWLYDNGLKDGDVKTYIKENKIVLKWEVDNEKNKNNLNND